MRMNMDKTVTMMISRNVRTIVNDTMIKEVEEFVYLGSKINSNGEIDGDINRKIRNSSQISEVV
jgi:hypothetical protein